MRLSLPLTRLLLAAVLAVVAGFGESLHAQPERLFDPALAPFYHGVASGDPLPDGVVLWTRVTTQQPQAEVAYYVATDTAFAEVVAAGTFATDATRDYTVKVDVRGLEPSTTYYYAFRFAGRNSLTGRTRTAPAPGDGTDHLRFALASCSNYDAGYFNAYDRIADRADLDAVFHVGDYIYEYADGVYGDPSLPDRETFPDAEITTLDEYRGRYSLYRLQRPLIRAHQQHPWIVTWDDHEIANDAWEFGAENHQPETEGDYTRRKAEATRAYFEWQPIRDPQTGEDSTVYRAFSYGDLADVSVLDSRHEGRDLQLTDYRDPALGTDRTALGDEQRDWLIDRLRGSGAQWKIVPQQVFFSPFNVGFGAAGGNITDPDSVAAVENFFLDIWDGYPFERQLLLDTIAEVEDVVILSGDIHSSFAADVTAAPVLYPLAAANFLPLPSPSYDPATGAGSRAVEFVTPSITAANFDENIGAATAAQFEAALNNPIPVTADLSVNYNPHIKYTDLDRHGYVTVDVRPEGVQGDFWYVPTISERVGGETWGAGLRTLSGASHLEPEDAPAAGKAVQPVRAGEQPSDIDPGASDATAAVQLIHDAYRQTVRVEVDGEALVPSFAYHTATPFLELPAGRELRVSLIPIGGTVPLADSVSFELRFDAGERYVATLNGNYDGDREIDLAFETLPGAPESVGAREVGLAFFHGAEGAPAVDVLVDGEVAYGSIIPGEYGDYLVTDAAPTYELAVRPAGGGEPLARYRTSLSFWKGRTAVVFASGDLEDGTFQPWVALDNGGTYPLFPVAEDAGEAIATTTAIGSVGVDRAPAAILLGVFPNPGRGEQNVRFAIEEAGAIDIDLVDVNGRRLRRVFAGEVSAGLYTHPVDVSELAAGAYFYVLSGADGTVAAQRALIE